MNTIHEGGVIAHFGRQRTEEVSDLLLLLDIDVEVADHHDAALGADVLFGATELSRGHVAFHDVDAVLLVEGNAGDLVETHHVVLANQPTLSGGVVHEHLRHGGLAAGNQVSVWRDLLEEVALARSARAKFDEIVVPFDKGNHAEQHDALRPLGEGGRFETDRPHQEVDPFRGAEFLTGLGEGVQDVGFRHLDRAQAVHLERTSAFFLSDDTIVGERDFGIEAVGQHSLVFAYVLVIDTDIPQIQTGKFRDIAVVLRVQAGAENVDDLDRSRLLCPGLEQLLFARADGPVLELLFDDLQAFGDLALVDAGAVASEEEFDHIGRHRVLARVFPHEVLPHEIPVEDRCGEIIELVEFHTHAFSPTVVGL